jgi:uncharacterized protein YgiM (DUF1202 family)
MPRLIVVLTLIIAIVPLSAAWSQTGGAAAPPNPAVEAPAPPAAPVNPPAAEVPPAPAAPVVIKKPRVTHHASQEAEFEPASGRLKLKKDTYVYSRASRLSKKLEKAHASKYVNVTGATRYYLRVKLKDGRTGYVPTSAVELVKPFDKDYILASDSPVYSEPNRWAKRVAEVHKGRNVHVTGITPSYIRIRMKDGVEGYVPQSAVE